MMKIAAFIVSLILAIVTLFMSLDKSDKTYVRIINTVAATIFLAAAIVMAYRGL